MFSRFKGPGRSGTLFVLFLLVWLTAFSQHLFSFTVFEGFSSLASDSFSYVRLARNWSPYDDPSSANLGTIPEQQRAPGLAWLLAFGGAAYSTHSAHLLVSLCMLLGLVICGWLAYAYVGWPFAAGVVVVTSMLPGLLVSSMGILSENFYLLLTAGALLMVERSRSNPDTSPGFYLALWAVLSLAVLTRSLGTALVLAVALAGLGDIRQRKRHGAALIMVAVAAVAAWMAWNIFGADNRAIGQHAFFSGLIGGNERSLPEHILHTCQVVKASLTAIVRAWGHYFTLGYPGAWRFLLSLLVMVTCLAAAAVRAVRMRSDAVYIWIYLAVITVWPYPEEMVRFLHPVMPLILLQPVLLLPQVEQGKNWSVAGWAAWLVMGLLLASPTAVHLRLVQLRSDALARQPEIAHSREYYSSLGSPRAAKLASDWAASLYLMSESARIVPVDGVVATVKHEAYMLMTDRRSSMLSSRVSYLQQLCNFKLRDVGYVFVSPVNSQLVADPYALVKEYESITAYQWYSARDRDKSSAVLLMLDKAAYEAELAGSGFVCREYRLQ